MSVAKFTTSTRGVVEETGGRKDSGLGFICSTMDEAFKYVYIPVDHTKQMVELWHPKNTNLEDDNLREKLKEHFAAAATLSSEALASYVTSVRARMPETTLDVRRMALSISVETFPLTIPTREAPRAVSMYTDEKAAHKKLPLNERAMGLAMACGATQQLRGDCFVSRYFDDEDAWIREDFGLDDMSSDASWIVATAKRRGPGGLAGLSSVYNKLGGGSPVKIDAAQLAKDDMEATRTHSDDVQWTQTEADVELRVALPPGTEKGAIVVASHRQSLRVAVGGNTKLDVATLFDQIDPEATCWTIDGSVLVITLEKAHPEHSEAWPRLDK